MTNRENIHLMISALRDRIDAEYDNAVRALGQLEEYLDASEADRQNAAFESGEDCRRLLRRYLRSGVSKRRIVLESLSSGWLSVSQIAEKTGLTKREVQGVLYAPEFKDKIQRTSMFGEVRFSASQR